MIVARVAAELSADPSLDVHRHTGGLGELRVQVDGADVVDTHRLWYPTPASVLDRVKVYLGAARPLP